MDTIQIYDAVKEEAEHIVSQLVHYNSTQLHFDKEPPFMHMNRCIKDGDAVVGGILSEIYWNVCYVEILWVKEAYRNRGYATALLTDLETRAKQVGCKLAHLDTFDFQAKDLYEKLGYKVFGVLDDCPEGHKRYYMSKKLT